MATEHSRSKSGMGGKGKKAKGGRIHTTHIKHFKSGGHSVTHEHEPSGAGDIPEPDESLMGDKASLMQHLQDTVPDNGPAQMTPPQAPPAAAGPGPGTGQPPPAGM